MIYELRHVTIYDYAAPVARSQHLLRLEPRLTPTQRGLYTRLAIDPEPSERQAYSDYFGNPTVYANIDQPHARLKVTATSRVSVEADTRLLPEPGPAWEAVRDALAAENSPDRGDAFQYVFDSPMIPLSPAMCDFAKQSFTPGRPILEAAHDLNHRIFTQFTYDPEATDIATPVAQALEQKAGVCQDFAHVMIGCLRAMGLPARYMSGYIRPHLSDDDPETRGAGASHAWVGLYLNDFGWIEYDPTNNALPNRDRTDHITLAWGRDYSDVTPIEGVALGGGNHTITVSVDMIPAAAPAASR